MAEASLKGINAYNKTSYTVLAFIFMLLISSDFVLCFNVNHVPFSRQTAGKSRVIMHAANGADRFDGVSNDSVSRRHLLGGIISSSLAVGTAAAATLLSNPSIASAKVVGAPFPSASSPSPSTPEREALFRAIANKSSDEVVYDAIQKLIPLNPMSVAKESAVNEALDGEWRLLWYNKSDFSPLLKLPAPIRPASFQYFGSIASKEVGEGRVAQGLLFDFLGINKELWLSAGSGNKEGDPLTLEIYPPFRFQLGGTPRSNAEKKTIVESESDADFRAVNLRDTDAQLAPKNEYQQLYLENFGKGSLRVSVVAKGDPVIVGDMFVHQKL